MCMLTLSNTTLKSYGDLVFKPQVYMFIPFPFIRSIRCIGAFFLYNNKAISTPVYTASELAISFQGTTKCDKTYTKCSPSHMFFVCCYTLHDKCGNKLDS